MGKAYARGELRGVVLGSGLSLSLYLITHIFTGQVILPAMIEPKSRAPTWEVTNTQACVHTHTHTYTHKHTFCTNVISTAPALKVTMHITHRPTWTFLVASPCLNLYEKTTTQ